MIAPAFPSDPRCHMLAVVLMAGYALRGMNRIRREIPGGLNAAHILLDVVLAERAARLPARESAERAAASTRDGTRSILAISAAIDVPRETVRRNLVALHEAGWLATLPAGGYRPSERAHRAFTLDDDASTLAEFIWIAGQVQATLTIAAEEIDAMMARHPWHVALATQREALAHPPYRATVAPLRARLRAADPIHREVLADIVDTYLYRHMNRLRRAFDGDLMLPVLIGEIAHRNISALAHRDDPTPEVARLSARFATPPAAPEALAPINAYSLSLAMDIPDATVRRKIAYLCRRGWIVVAPGGTLSVAGTVREHAAELNDQSLADMMTGHRALCALGIAP